MPIVPYVDDIQFIFIAVGFIVFVALCMVILRRVQAKEQMKEAVDFDLMKFIYDYPMEIANNWVQMFMIMLGEGAFLIIPTLKLPFEIMFIAFLALFLGGGCLWLIMNDKMMRSYLNLNNIDSEINTDKIQEPVYIKKLREPIPIKTKPSFMKELKESAIKNAGESSFLKEYLGRFFGVTKKPKLEEKPAKQGKQSKSTLIRNGGGTLPKAETLTEKPPAKEEPLILGGNKLYQYALQSDENPHKVILIQSREPWDIVYRPKGDPPRQLPTTWGKVRVREAHMDLFYCGSFKNISDDEMYKKLKVGEAKVPVFSVMSPLDPMPNYAEAHITAVCNEQMNASVGREELGKAKADAAYWEEYAHFIEHSKRSADAIRHKDIIQKTGEVPRDKKVHWPDWLKNRLVWVGAAIVLGMGFGIWLATTVLNPP